MNLRNIIFKGIAFSAIALTVSCSDDYLETNPTRYLEEETVTATRQKTPTKVQA